MALVVLAGCGSSTPGSDAGMDGGSDAGLLPCARAAVSIGGTPETDALANAPARCGAPAYQWVRSESLGQVVSRAETDSLTARELTAIAIAGGVVLPQMPEHDVRVERVVYTTQDRGTMVETSMALAFPVDLAERGELPILLFTHGTSGFTRGCGPSNDAASRLLGALFASWGWIVAAPDYLGLESAGADYAPPHPYLVGEATAIASIDAARAAADALADDGGAACASSRVAVFGGSQGGHAALWVDRLAPYYGRELELIGSVATVPPADVLGQAQRSLTQVVEGTAAFMAMLATEPAWYGTGDRLEELFASPWDVDLPAALDATCDPGSALTLPTALSDVFQPLLLDAAAAGALADVVPFGCYVAQSGLTTTDVPRIGPSSPSYGILFVLGENDTLVHPPLERDAYDALCAAGMPLNYLECAGASHTAATLWALPEILTFLSARLAGEPFSSQCVRSAAVTCGGTPP